VLRGPKRRQRISAAFDALCEAVAAALGAASRSREAAVAAHAETMFEMWLRSEGLDAARTDPALRPGLRNPRLAGAVARVEADRAEVFEPWLRDSPEELAGIVTEAAPGAAGADPDGWLGEVGKVEGAGPVPQLWRIGSARIGDDAATSFPVAVPMLDESHLQVVSTHDSRTRAEALIEGLLMRVLSYFRPGLVQVHVWDLNQFTGALPGLYPLTRTGLLAVHDPGRLPQLLDELSDRIRRVHTRVLVDGHSSLRELAGTTGVRTEPWLVAVLVGNRSALCEDEHRQLQRVARGGLACGVQLVLLDVPMTVNAAVETVRIADDGTATTSMTGPYATVTLDSALPRDELTRACHTIADEHERWRGRVGAFTDLLPARALWGRSSSRTGLHAPIGFAEGMPVEIALADASPHALVAGPSGSGKTNLLLTMISSLAARYDPDELELYLLDFKEGVSFAQFTPGRRDTTWLPHARLVGVNINTDREFGLALLRFLADEMRRRAEAAKAHEVTKLEELRAADSRGRWPRIVAIVDEFQFLFGERDEVSRAATALLEDVARRGRSQGIHLVLASQDVSGIEAFWGRPAIFEQFVLRIGLPRARHVLADLNDATLGLPRWHAVVNHESGIRHGNVVVRIPEATDVNGVQRHLHATYQAGRVRPRLFDGSRAPRFRELEDALDSTGGVPRALLGQCIDVGGSAATVPLPAAPGRNIGVIGSGAADAVRVLGAAAGSLARQLAPDALDVVLAPLVPDALLPAARLARVFDSRTHRCETVELDGVRARVEGLAAELSGRLAGGGVGARRTTLVVLYGADAAEPVLGRGGLAALRQLLRFGPETGLHVLGWWRSVQRLKSVLSLSASPDDVGSWVGLDVQGAELGVLSPAGMMPHWSPRPGRGLFFDRAQHARPVVIIVPALEGEL
jgi:hypothetical protein